MALHVRINVPAFPAAIEAVAEGLVLLNLVLMEYAADGGVELPPLYETNVRYRREPRGREWWENATDVLGVVSDRSGDCEDLSAFRAAELRFTGEDPDAFVRILRTKRGTFHAVVERGDGSIEDPSEILVYQERAERHG
jgi:hypothetical protein